MICFFFDNFNDIQMILYLQATGHIIQNTSRIAFLDSYKNVSNRSLARENVLRGNTNVVVRSNQIGL